VVEDVILRSLSKFPGDRFNDISLFADVLECLSLGDSGLSSAEKAFKSAVEVSAKTLKTQMDEDVTTAELEADRSPNIPVQALGKVEITQTRSKPYEERTFDELGSPTGRKKAQDQLTPGKEKPGEKQKGRKIPGTWRWIALGVLAVLVVAIGVVGWINRDLFSSQADDNAALAVPPTQTPTMIETTAIPSTQAPTRTTSPTKTPEPTSTRTLTRTPTQTIVVTATFIYADLSLKGVSEYSGSEMMISVDVPGLKDADFIGSIDGNGYVCDRTGDTVEWLYCIGPQLEEGEEVDMAFYRQNDDDTMTMAFRFIVPSYKAVAADPTQSAGGGGGDSGSGGSSSPGVYTATACDGSGNCWTGSGSTQQEAEDDAMAQCEANTDDPAASCHIE
jgi:hypothetical protein